MTEPISDSELLAMRRGGRFKGDIDALIARLDATTEKLAEAERMLNYNYMRVKLEEERSRLAAAEAALLPALRLSVGVQAGWSESGIKEALHAFQEAYNKLPGMVNAAPPTQEVRGLGGGGQTMPAPNTAAGFNIAPTQEAEGG